MSEPRASREESSRQEKSEFALSNKGKYNPGKSCFVEVLALRTLSHHLHRIICGHITMVDPEVLIEIYWALESAVVLPAI
jgi:hypothetical protein